MFSNVASATSLPYNLLAFNARSTHFTCCRMTRICWQLRCLGGVKDATKKVPIFESKIQSKCVEKIDEKVIKSGDAFRSSTLSAINRSAIFGSSGDSTSSSFSSLSSSWPARETCHHGRQGLKASCKLDLPRLSRNLSKNWRGILERICSYVRSSFWGVPQNLRC